ncbi:uncharacterized protein LOC128744502 [Sabethes cyaneus]|uniref:uncharacterized protein LOC128744502 n=1 Tax=Sabethes cyaneus TaxID=53552 RepID=UPI00237D6EEB|nr:uncharacterized protein LOC128744502 [Sabethes cyaneus]
MSGEDPRSFCREAMDQTTKATEKMSFIQPGKYRDPLPFNLKNPYAFTAKFFVISTIGFAAPFLVVLYSMYKTGRTT